MLAEVYRVKNISRSRFFKTTMMSALTLDNIEMQSRKMEYMNKQCIDIFTI
jgi:hypothetical protein